MMIMKYCPYCTENIQDKAIYCRFCKNDLPSLELKEKELFIHARKLSDDNLSKVIAKVRTPTMLSHNQSDK